MINAVLSSGLKILLRLLLQVLLPLVLLVFSKVQRLKPINLIFNMPLLTPLILICCSNVRARAARVRTEFDKSAMKCAQEYRRHLCWCSWALHYWLRQTSTLGSGAFDTPVKSTFLVGRAQFYAAFIQKALGSDHKNTGPNGTSRARQGPALHCVLRFNWPAPGALKKMFIWNFKKKNVYICAVREKMCGCKV